MGRINPNTLLKRIGQLTRKQNSSPNFRSDGSVGGQQFQSGMATYNPLPLSFMAVITGGTNPYSYRSILVNIDGTIELEPLTVLGLEGQTSGMFPSEGMFRSAWELNGVETVLPGTIVELFPTAHRTDSQDLDYGFFAPRDLTVIGQIDQLPADVPNTTLTANLSATALTLTVASTAFFPPPPQTGPRFPFNVIIDYEVIKVTEITGTTWTIERGVEGTVATEHLSGAEVELGNQYSWYKMVPSPDGGDQWNYYEVGGEHPGKEIAIELSSNCFVPRGTVFFATRRFNYLPGRGTLADDMTVDQTTISAVFTGMPASTVYWTTIMVDGEIMYYNNAGTVVRGKFGTAATIHESGATVYEVCAQWTFNYSTRPPKDVILYWTADEYGDHTNTAADDDFLYSNIAISKYGNLPTNVDYTQFEGQIRAKDLSGRNSNMMEGARYHGRYEGIIEIATVPYHLYSFTAIPGIGFTLYNPGGQDVIASAGAITGWTIEADPYNLVSLDMGLIIIQNERFYGWWDCGTIINYAPLAADQQVGTITYGVGGPGDCTLGGCYIEIPYDTWLTRPVLRYAFLGTSGSGEVRGQHSAPEIDVVTLMNPPRPFMPGTQGCITLGQAGYAEFFWVDVIDPVPETQVIEDFTEDCYFWASRIGDAPIP